MVIWILAYRKMRGVYVIIILGAVWGMMVFTLIAAVGGGLITFFWSFFPLCVSIYAPEHPAHRVSAAIGAKILEEYLAAELNSKYNFTAALDLQLECQHSRRHTLDFGGLCRFAPFAAIFCKISPIFAVHQPHAEHTSIVYP